MVHSWVCDQCALLPGSVFVPLQMVIACEKMSIPLTVLTLLAHTQIHSQSVFQLLFHYALPLSFLS